MLALPSVALSANPDFPGDPGENPRVDTPDDPEFDHCEADDEDGTQDCDSYAEEEFRAFGFSPDSANQVAPAVGPHYATGTRYANCDQLDPQGRRANIQAENAGNPAGDALAECLQIAGVRADGAWKFSTGDPETTVAILDTGIRWQSTELVNKVDLNEDELPAPQNPGPGFDPDAYRVSDFASEAAVDAGDDEADGILDGSDLIATFSDGVDDDGNGYADDIAGWDFFDDDNDPFDASSCCSAGGHGTGRAAEAVAQTNNGPGEDGAGVGMCPDCQLMPLRVWDTFVVPTDNYALGALYATRNGADVIEGAVGGLTNTQFARRVFSYADQQGLALMLVSSDINSANHNYPTNYNEAVYVAGAIYDTAPNNTCAGPGGLPGLPDLPIPDAFRDAFDEGCQQFLGRLRQGSGCAGTTPAPTCINPFVGQPLTTSFFRNSNLTQYGGKADIVLMGSTGSENTGQSSGIAALLMSFGRAELGGAGINGNEVRQLLTMTAEDVLPENTGAIGLPDKANPGWDPHFGYGRVNAATAMARISNDRQAVGYPPKGSPDANGFQWPCADTDDTCIPPQAQIDAPDWFAPINVDRVPDSGVEIRGRALARDVVGAWEVEYACGQDALDSEFQGFEDFTGNPADAVAGTGPVQAGGSLGFIPKAVLADLADNCNGEVTADAGRPAGGAGDAWPADPYDDSSSSDPTQDTDPERHTFQIRLTVHEADDPLNIGRYRKTLHAYRNDGNLAGWPRPVGLGANAPLYRTGSGGEASPRLFDVDGDNALDVVQATSSGQIFVLNSDGSPVQSFNAGQPVSTDRYELEASHPGAVPAALADATPHESLRVPAIGDIDGDLEPEIVATAGEHLYAWNMDGTRAFRTGVLQALSEPCEPGADLSVSDVCFDPDDRLITSDNHIKRGFIGSPVLADLDPQRPGLEITAGALDQHLYAWDGNGNLLDGFPVKLQTPNAPGAEIITTPAIAELDGAAPPEIVLSTNEVAKTGFPNEIPSLFEFMSLALGAGTGANPVYAVRATGTAQTGDGDDADAYVDGWPSFVGVAAGSLLPLVLPGHDSAVLDSDEDGNDEVSITAGTSVMPTGARLVDGNGQTLAGYDSSTGNRIDPGPILNLADYQSIGDIEGSGRPAVVKGGLTANGAANLLAVNQNLPFNHVEQAFDVTLPPDENTGLVPSLAGYPRATDDFQLVSQASIARVGATAAPGGRQALVGTGLYQLHAYGPGGFEPAGWPKFTGGWTQATPAVGDADGDGDLDVTTLTREGWSFLWDTGVNACTGSNEEWWTYHHDEHSTANYGTDGRPPGTPEDLTARQGQNGGVRLSVTAPGDDWLCGQATKFRVILSRNGITRPTEGRTVGTFDAEAASGETETFGLGSGDVGDARFLAVLYRDEAGNWGHVAETGITQSGPPPPGGLKPGACANTKRGGPRSQTLRGTRAGDRILGFGGRDRIFGLRAQDCLLGGRGPDRLEGGRGRDRLKGGTGRDRLIGGDGADRLLGGRGNDVIGARGDIRDRINCGPGRDVARVDRKDIVRGCEVVRRRKPR